MKVLSIAGARPQFIKVAALHRAIVKEMFQHVIVHTGQHYDYYLSDIFFKELELPPPAFHLTVDDLSLSASVQRMSEAIEKLLPREKPDIVVVFGDTNSTLAGALAARKLNIRIAHVEAGLRSYNTAMPEEHNRVETDKISDLLFCPTTRAMRNLIQEGFNTKECKLILSGDIMLDAMNYYREKLSSTDDHWKIIPRAPFVLCTLHRQHLVESPDKLAEVINALNEINRLMPVIMPAHPRFKRVVEEAGLTISFGIREPVGYLQMIALLHNCDAVITDSGGLQKEAFFCRKPCITVRNETEWTELVLAGVNFIAGDSSSNEIVTAFNKAITLKGNFEQKFYGEGNCAGIIVEEVGRLVQ